MDSFTMFLSLCHTSHNKYDARFKLKNKEVSSQTLGFKWKVKELVSKSSMKWQCPWQTMSD